MLQPAVPAATWKRAVAALLDFLTGYLIGLSTGSLTADGFNLTGASALLLFAVLAAYFFVGRRFAGGTLWDRVFRIARPQPT
jgi:hypothetical protein